MTSIVLQFSFFRINFLLPWLFSNFRLFFNMFLLFHKVFVKLIKMVYRFLKYFNKLNNFTIYKFFQKSLFDFIIFIMLKSNREINVKIELIYIIDRQISEHGLINTSYMWFCSVIIKVFYETYFINISCTIFNIWSTKSAHKSHRPSSVVGFDRQLSDMTESSWSWSSAPHKSIKFI